MEYGCWKATKSVDLTKHGDRYTCIKERTTRYRYTDAAPGSGNYFGRYGTTGQEPTRVLRNQGGCNPGSSTIVPLTSDKSELRSKIDRLPTTGSTVGHLGTQWAWYLISPNWAGIWPSESTPHSYDLVTEKNEDGRPKLYKIAVLMTDGSYNRQYSGSRSATQAREICKAMKSAGVTVYTVGFINRPGSEPDRIMQECATLSSHYYNASHSEALKSAFRDIALKIADLRLAE